MQDWLFTSGNCQWSHNFNRRERIDFARGPVEAFMEQREVLPGIQLFRAGANGRSAFRIAMDGTSSEGQIVLGAMLGGAGTVTMEGAEEQDWREDGRFFALAPIERRVAYDVWALRDWQAVALRLEAGALDMLGASGALPQVVRESLSGTRTDMAMTAPLSGTIRTVGHALLRPIYDGATGHIYRQGKVLELLAHQFAVLGIERPHNGEISSQERRSVREARERLLADLRDPPDLTGLAAAVGMTPRRLNRSFRIIHGTTVFDYLRDARLDAARQALEGGSPLPLKQLAWELGYSQASNFVTAFRRRFGVTPGSYRSEGQQDYARR